MDNPCIHAGLCDRAFESRLSRVFPLVSHPPRYPLGGPWRGREWNPCARLRIGTCMYSIGLRIKEPSSHMAPKRSPYHLPPFRSHPPSVPLPSLFVVPSVSLFLSLRLFHPGSLAPLWHPYPPRTLQFSNEFVLADYVSQRSTYLPRCEVCVCVGMFIIRAFILAR